MAEYIVINAHRGDEPGKRRNKGDVFEGDPADPDIRGHLRWGNIEAHKPVKKSSVPAASSPAGGGGDN